MNNPDMNKKKNKDRAQDSQQQSADIPKFNLADDIMADHRKTIATKRKSPNQKSQIPIQTSEIGTPINPSGQSPPAQHDEDEIIRGIVAKDIERLCRGENPDN